MTKSLFHIAALCFALLISVGKADAIEFTIGEKDINRFVQAAFPQKYAYQGADVFFSDPVLSLDGLDNKVKITVNIAAYRNNQVLKATAQVGGELIYDAVDYNLQIKEPNISKFKVTENNIANSEQLIRGIRDVVGQSMPLIVLIDLDNFDIGFGKIQPKSIAVGHKKLVITL